MLCEDQTATRRYQQFSGLRASSVHYGHAAHAPMDAFLRFVVARGAGGGVGVGGCGVWWAGSASRGRRS